MLSQGRTTDVHDFGCGFDFAGCFLSSVGLSKEAGLAYAMAMRRRENAKKAFIVVLVDGVGMLQYAAFYTFKGIGVEIWTLNVKHSL